MHNAQSFHWSDLPHFLAVARLGSTVAAAKSLRVSQSTVHRRLEELEARLGRPIVVRHASGYRLTDFGAQLLPLVERVEMEVTSLERFVRASDTLISGSIRLTCSETIGFRLVRAKLLERFQLTHPGVTVEMVMSDRFLDLAKGDADVAIRAGQPDDETLIGKKLADVSWGLFASSEYLRRHGRLERLDEIAHHSLIELDGSIANTDIGKWMSACKGAKIVGRSSSVTGMLMSVKSGVGIAPLPLPLGRSDADLELLLMIPEVSTGIYLLTHPDLRSMPRIIAFFDFMKAEHQTVRRALIGEL
jgi:DNA-binding transcriptional LysR family regulator